MKPTIGRIVHYRLSQEDLESIMELIKGNESLLVATPKPGDIVPAVVVKVNTDGSINLKALLDGDPDLWVTDVLEGQDIGQYQWQAADPKERPMLFRFSRLWSICNFENMKADIERQFPAGTSAAEAMAILSQELENARAKLIERQRLTTRYLELQCLISRNESTAKLLDMSKQELEQIRKDLDITDIAPELAAAPAR